MNRKTKLWAVCLLGAWVPSVYGQSADGWTLRRCIEYARANNIEVRSSQIARQSALVDLEQAQAQKTPSLSFSTTQSYRHAKNESRNFASNGTYEGNYALNAGITIYNGGKLKNSLLQQHTIGKSRDAEVEMARNSIEIAVTQAYLEILYAAESVKTDEQTVESSEAQMNRAKALFEAGSISRSDYAQIESQYAGDRYQLTSSRTRLSESRLALKQLLELGLDDSFEVVFPELDSTDVLAEIPALEEVYRTALAVMPEVENSRLDIESSQIGEKIARAEGRPTLTADASIGTGNTSGSDYAFYNQLDNKLNERAGITFSVPIFNRKQAKSSIAKARLQTLQAELNYVDTEKNLLRTVESLYQDAVSAQSRYLAAADRVRSAGLSYRLMLEQFEAGMKNTVELLTEKNNFLSAQQEQIQAKYQAVLSLRLLNFYRDQPIQL
ncbi:TolC family protein [uncultured Alistipes sp.]|uniref:TolC family protein n=1 Tax=uncultured Alistipes sp. TaxID=538949 RepID=UPI00260D8C36|nr:TolC family protein [uncultured Alistipes sp.]